jgi:hypothetical protein
MTYRTVQQRRTNFGAGIAQIHKRAGITEKKYGVGLWSENRPEWQIAGTVLSIRLVVNMNSVDKRYIKISDACLKHYIQCLYMKRWDRQQPDTS